MAPPQHRNAPPAALETETALGNELADAVAAVMVKARRALFITGAGISADSGLPTYRGVGGLYDGVDPDEGLPIEVLLSGEMMRARPEVAWKYIRQVERACRGAEPNRGHHVLAELGKRLERAVVLTQNVDGFHRKAGSEHVLEIHGNLHDLRCTRCPWRTSVSDYAQLAMPADCPECRGLVRPDVVLFGEPLPDSALSALEEELARGFDVVFAIGTSALFPYIARPILVAKSEGVPTIEINPGKTDLSDIVDYRIRASAKTALKAIWAAYRALAPRRTRVGR